MESNKVTPFGEYGVHINDSRQNSICKPDMTRLSECEYLMQRGCSFDIYKWSGTDYDKELNFNGNNFTRQGTKYLSNNGIPSMHIWFETIEDLQKWLGEYYDSAITTMLANKNGDIWDTQYDQSISSNGVSGMVPNNNTGWAYLNGMATNPINMQQQQPMTIGHGSVAQANTPIDKIEELLKALDNV